MDEKMNVLLKKINIDEDSYQYFQDAKLTKIKINSSTNSWNVFIEKNNLLPVNILEELESKFNKQWSIFGYVSKRKQADFKYYGGACSVEGRRR